VSAIMKSAIREVGRQVREQHQGREWCKRHPYPGSMAEILGQELDARTLSPSSRVVRRGNDERNAH